MSFEISKRDFLFGISILGIGASTPGSASAQNATLQINPESAGKIHHSMVSFAANSIVKNDPLSEHSIFNLLDILYKEGIFSEIDYNSIKEIISKIFSTRNLDDIQNIISSIFNDIKDKLSDVGKAIFTIISDSVSIAKELLSSLDFNQILDAILHDIRGAMDGALNGSTLFKNLGRSNPLAGALIGAIIGAASASTIGIYKQN